MKRLTVLLTAMVAAIVLASGVALSQTTPSGTLDANTLPPSDPTNVCDEASFGGNHGELGTWGQTFTALHSGNVHSVQLSVRGFDQTVTEPWTPPMDDISVRLTTVDASGKPDTNTILATTTVPASVLGQHHSLVSASFTNPPTIEAGRQYALVLSGQNENNRSGYSWEIQCPRGQYSGGMLMLNIPADGGFIPDARYGGGLTDAVFAICLNGPCPNGSQTPVFDFAGFFQPVDNPPTTNVVQAGRSIPLKFSLGGDQGLDIFAEGYPHSGTIPEDPDAPLDNLEQTVSAGASSLSYDATSDQYHYVWKTEEAWSGQTRQLVLKLTDGSEHTANFQFR